MSYYLTAVEQTETEYLRENQQLREEIASCEALIAEMDSFSHTVAHDLKNPLALIAGYTSLLISDLAPVVDDQQAEMLDQVFRIAEKSIHIVDEMLIMAGVRHQNVELLPINTADIVYDVECRLKIMIEEKQAEIIHPETWPLAMGKPIWVEEIWSNYISNALKYGGSPPRIELGATPQEDGMMRFWVKDNGDGLSPEAQTRLFTDFERLSNNHAPGHGLGLSIVKRIVEKLGGQVGVASANIPGEGSTFFFTLPQFTRREL
jgi:two-component system sensor histidine kinase/response regulator